MKPKVFIPIRSDETFACLDDIRNADGLPLWKAFLYGLRDFDLFVDTDSEAIKKTIDADADCRCTTVIRDPCLRGDLVATNDLIAAFLDRYWIQHEAIIQTHITHPFLSATTLWKAWSALAVGGAHDSVIGVSVQSKRLWSRDERGFFPINHNPMNLRRTSQLPPIYFEDSAFYVFTAERFRAVGNRLGLNPFFFEIAAPETIAITCASSWRDLQATAASLVPWTRAGASAMQPTPTGHTDAD